MRSLRVALDQRISAFITYQAYTPYSKEELNKNRIFTAKTGSLLYSGKI